MVFTGLVTVVFGIPFVIIMGIWTIASIAHDNHEDKKLRQMFKDSDIAAKEAEFVEDQWGGKFLKMPDWYLEKYPEKKKRTEAMLGIKID